MSLLPTPERCVVLRTGNNPKKLAGQQRVWRCGRWTRASVQVFQTRDHAQIATGWYRIPVCERCLRESA